MTESLHDPPRRKILSGRRALGRSDRARHAAGPDGEGGGGFRRAHRDRIPRPADQLCRTGRSKVETAASAFLRAGYGKNTSVALFLGNSPDHPVNFFGALKAGSRVVHLSPLDGEIALSHKLSDSRRAHSGHQQSRRAVADGAEISRQGPARSADRLRGRRLGRGRQSANSDSGRSEDRHVQDIRRRRNEAGAMAVDHRPTTSRCCNIPAAPPACPRARCSATAISPRRCRCTTSGARPRAPSATPIERVICVLPLFHIFALTVVLLR